jgi:syntaxin 5
MFQKLSGLVAQQAEMVTRIDADLDDATSSIDAAQAQLHKYYRAMQGNRGLILKAFAVLLIVMLVWSIVGKKR